MAKHAKGSDDKQELLKKYKKEYADTPKTIAKWLVTFASQQIKLLEYPSSVEEYSLFLP